MVVQGESSSYLTEEASSKGGSSKAAVPQVWQDEPSASDLSTKDPLLKEGEEQPPVRRREERKTDDDDKDKTRKNWIYGSILVVVLLIIWLPLLFLVIIPAIKDHKEGDKKASQTTDAPMVPVEPQNYFELDSYLPSYTLEALKNGDEATPQARAYRWVMEDPSKGLYAPERLLQRFALATLFYATNGEHWNTTVSEVPNDDDIFVLNTTTQTARWLSYDTPECEWVHTEAKKDDEEDEEEALQPEDTTEAEAPPPISFIQQLCGKRRGPASPGEPQQQGTSFAAPARNHNRRKRRRRRRRRREMNQNQVHRPIAYDNDYYYYDYYDYYYYYDYYDYDYYYDYYDSYDSYDYYYYSSYSYSGSWRDRGRGRHRALADRDESVSNIDGHLRRHNLPPRRQLTKEQPKVHRHGGQTGLPRPQQRHLMGGEPMKMQRRLHSAEEERDWEPVRRLHFPSNSLVGTLPPQLALLTAVESIDLSHNDLKGSLPTQIFGSLNQLTSLILQDNYMSGILPTEIGLWSNLKHSRGSTGRGSGQRHKKGMTLDLSYNRLSETLPKELGQLSDLRTLNLAANQFMGPLMFSNLGALTKLENLVLYQNQLTGGLPSALFGLTHLKQLEVDSNKLVGVLPTQLGTLKYLERLLLYNNGWVGSIPTEVGTLQNLRVLGLTESALTGRIPSEIGLMSRLMHLWLYKNYLTGWIPAELGGLADSGDLKILMMHDNDLIGVVPNHLCNLSHIQFDCADKEEERILCGCNCTCSDHTEVFMLEAVANETRTIALEAFSNETTPSP